MVWLRPVLKARPYHEPPSEIALWIFGIALAFSLATRAANAKRAEATKGNQSAAKKPETKNSVPSQDGRPFPAAPPIGPRDRAAQRERESVTSRAKASARIERCGTNTHWLLTALVGARLV